MKLFFDGSLWVDTSHFSAVQVTGKTTGAILFKTGVELEITAEEAEGLIEALSTNNRESTRPNHCEEIFDLLTDDWQATSSVCAAFTSETDLTDKTFYRTLTKLDDAGAIERKFNRIRRAK